MKISAEATGRKIPSLFRWILILIPVLLLLAYLGLGAVVANEVTQPKRPFYPEASTRLGTPYQDVRLPARSDGLEIAGWYVLQDGPLFISCSVNQEGG